MIDLNKLIKDLKDSKIDIDELLSFFVRVISEGYSFYPLSSSIKNKNYEISKFLIESYKEDNNFISNQDLSFSIEPLFSMEDDTLLNLFFDNKAIKAMYEFNITYHGCGFTFNNKEKSLQIVKFLESKGIECKHFIDSSIQYNAVDVTTYLLDKYPNYKISDRIMKNLDQAEMALVLLKRGGNIHCISTHLTDKALIRRIDSTKKPKTLTPFLLSDCPIIRWYTAMKLKELE